MGFPGGTAVKNLPANAGDMGLILGEGKPPWRKKWQLTVIFLPGKSHGQRNWQAIVYGAAKESDTTERLNNGNNFKTDTVRQALAMCLACRGTQKIFPL